MVAFAGRNDVVEIPCVACGTIVKLFLNWEDFQAWQDGELVQDAFPYLSADEREMLISGICGTCFDKIFAAGDE